MKISAKRVFIADLYKAVNYKQSSIIAGDFAGETEFGFRDFDNELVKRSVILIKFGSRYVPVEYCQNMIAYLGLSGKVSGGWVPSNDERFIGEGRSSAWGEGVHFLLELKPLKATEKKRVSLKKLYALQLEYDEAEFTQHTGRINNSIEENVVMNENGNNEIHYSNDNNYVPKVYND